MHLARRTAAPLLVAGVFAAIASSGKSATISLNPTADAFVSSANPAYNYGGAGALQVSAAGLPAGEFESVLQFDLSSAKSSFDATFGSGQWSVQSETLQLTAFVGRNPIFNQPAAGQFAVSWMQNDTWTEGSGTPMAPGGTGITFNSLPSFLSSSDQTLGTFSFDGSTSGTFNYSLALATGLVGDADTGGLTSLRLLATDTMMSALFNSRSFAIAASRPVLTIVATAAPPSWNYNGSGNYSDDANWSQPVPNGIGATASFGNGATTAINVQALSVKIDSAVYVGALIFNSASTSYTLASDGVSGDGLVLNNNGVSATVNVIAGSHTISAPITVTNGLTVTGAGALTLSGAANNFTGPIAVGTGADTPKLVINAASASTVASGVIVTVASGATLELDGTASALTDSLHPLNRASVQNDGSFIIGAAAMQQVGGIDPYQRAAGSVVVSNNAQLTADHINQLSLAIGSGATLTIAPSNSDGSPMASQGSGSSLVLAGSLTPTSSIIASSDSLLGLGGASVLALPALGEMGGASINAVPEPASGLLFGFGALSLFSIGMASRKRSARQAPCHRHRCYNPRLGIAPLRRHRPMLCLCQKPDRPRPFR